MWFYHIVFCKMYHLSNRKCFSAGGSWRAQKNEEHKNLEIDHTKWRPFFLRSAKVDRALQITIPESRTKVFFVPFKLLLPLKFCHIEAKCMRGTMQRKYFWTYVTFSVYNYIFSCEGCSATQSSTEHVMHVEPVLAKNLLHFTVTDILSLLHKKVKVSWHIVIIMDQNLNLRIPSTSRGFTFFDA